MLAGSQLLALGADLKTPCGAEGLGLEGAPGYTGSDRTSRKAKAEGSWALPRPGGEPIGEAALDISKESSHYKTGVALAGERGDHAVYRRHP